MALTKKVESLTDPSNVLARYHPLTKPEKSDLGFDIDNSVNSLEWILKCRRIVSGISNVGFEAMLLGRAAYVVCEKAPYYPAGIGSIRCIEESASQIKMLNYILFGYFVPWDLMFDCDYIFWRLSSPEPLEIYKYNLAYMLKKESLDYKKMFEMNQKQRYEYILRYKHGLTDGELKKYVKRTKEKTYTEMQTYYVQELENKDEEVKNIHKQLTDEIERLQTEIILMQNSTSWKLTKPLRHGGDALRKLKKDKSIIH